MLILTSSTTGCAKQFPEFDGTRFQSMAVCITLPSSVDSDRTDRSTRNHATTWFTELANPLPDASDRIELAEGLYVRCSISDGSRLSVGASVSAFVVSERTDFLARCAVSGLEIPVWVTVDPP